MPTIAERKAILRAMMRVARRDAARTHRWSAGAMPRFDRVVVLASYRPLPGEPDPVDAEVRLSADQLCYPRILGDGAMEFARARRAADWVPGPHGTTQPSDRCPVTIPTIILVPLLAFDRSGGRLGQGGGHYDRALAAHPDAVTIGVAWSVQEVEAVPLEPWDRLLDHIVTEKEWITP